MLNWAYLSLLFCNYFKIEQIIIIQFELGTNLQSAVIGPKITYYYFQHKSAFPGSHLCRLHSTSPVTKWVEFNSEKAFLKFRFEIFGPTVKAHIF